MEQKYFAQVFANAGDTTAVPDAVQSNGSVSYNQGYGPNYEKDLSTDASALPIPRGSDNYLWNAATANLQQWQQYGIPQFITSTDNGGTPFPYDQNVIVRYRPNTGVAFTYWVSTVAANTATPGDLSGNWQALILIEASIATVNAGIDGATLITPRRLANRLASYAPLNSPQFAGVPISNSYRAVGIAANVANNQGLYSSWNEIANSGTAVFVNNIGTGGVGGFVFRSVNLTNTVELGRTTFAQDGSITVPNLTLANKLSVAGDAQINGTITTLAIHTTEDLQIDGNGKFSGYIEINGANSRTAANFGYLNTTGAGVSGSAQGIAAGLYTPQGILCAQIWASSDRRLKTDIAPIDTDEAIAFVKRVTPVVYFKDGCEVRERGFIAQDVSKAASSSGREMVGVSKREGLQEEIDEDGYLSPADVQLGVDHNQIVAMHATVIRDLMERLERAEDRIAMLLLAGI